MNKIIVNKIVEITELIKKDGKEINGTKELTGVFIPKLDISKMDLVEEENQVRNYYSEIGINTQAIRSLEHNLY